MNHLLARARGQMDRIDCNMVKQKVKVETDQDLIEHARIG